LEGVGAAVSRDGVGLGAVDGLGGEYGFGGTSFLGSAAGFDSAAPPRVPTFSFGLYFFSTASL